MRVVVPVSLASCVAIASACATYGEDAPPEPSPTASDGGVSADLGVSDGGEAGCDPSKDFGEPAPLAFAVALATQGSPRLSEDELTIWFDGRSGDEDFFHAFWATRASIRDAFSAPRRLLEDVEESGYDHYSPNVTTDGLRVIFERQAPGSHDSQLLMSARITPGGPFVSTGVLLGIDTPGYEGTPYVRGDGGEVWYSATGPDKSIDIFAARLASGSYVVQRDPTLNSAAADYAPVISKDGLVAYFASGRASPNAPGGDNVWVATRDHVSSSFGPPVMVAGVNGDGDDIPGWISADGCRLYLTRRTESDASLSQAIYVAERPR